MGKEPEKKAEMTVTTFVDDGRAMYRRIAEFRLREMTAYLQHDVKRRSFASMRDALRTTLECTGAWLDLALDEARVHLNQQGSTDTTSSSSVSVEIPSGDVLGTLLQRLDHLNGLVDQAWQVFKKDDEEE